MSLTCVCVALMVEQEVRDKPPNKNAHCMILKLADGIPAAAGLAFAFILCLYLWFTKTKSRVQLSHDEMKRLREIKDRIHNDIFKKHKDLKVFCFVCEA